MQQSEASLNLRPPQFSTSSADAESKYELHKPGQTLGTALGLDSEALREAEPQEVLLDSVSGKCLGILNSRLRRKERRDECSH